MTSQVLPNLSDRLDVIEKEIKGVKSLYNITQWELDFMKSLRGLKFGSDKQIAILRKIEVKVFGHDHETSLQ